MKTTKPELDKFASGRATIRGQVCGNRIVVDSVTKAERKPRSETEPTDDDSENKASSCRVRGRVFLPVGTDSR